MKRMTSILSVLAISALGFASFAQAAPVTCEDSSGSCELDTGFFTCECASGVAVAGTNASEPRDTETPPDAVEPTEEACLVLLEENCAAWEVVDSCSSEKGACQIFAGGFSSCECADGMGGGSGGSEPGWDGEDDGSWDDGGFTDPDTAEPPRARIKDEALVCDDILLENCPNDPPDPAEHCDSEALDTCTDVAAWYADCYDQTLWPYMIIDCCGQVEQDGENFAEMWSCLQASTCEGASECFGDAEAQEALFGADPSKDDGAGDGVPRGDDADDTLGGEKDGEESGADDGKGGCSQTSSPAWLGLLALMGLALRRRLA